MTVPGFASADEPMNDAAHLRSVGFHDAGCRRVHSHGRPVLQRYVSVLTTAIAYAAPNKSVMIPADGVATVALEAINAEGTHPATRDGTRSKLTPISVG
jgi:hypothetical protein